MDQIIHISFAKRDFSCPHCQKAYEDITDFYHYRMEKNKKGYTTVKCECNNKFGLAVDITGQYIGFELQNNKINNGI